MFTSLEAWLAGLVGTLPLPGFAFFASFVEEVVAPIPSPTVMVLTGVIAAEQGYVLYGLLGLAVIAALGKTLGALLVYGIAAKLEYALVPRLGKYFDVTHEDIARLGARLTGTSKDYLVVTLVRAFPFVPSSVVSVGCGVLHLPLPLYTVATFIGTIVRDSFYLYTGYAGLQVLHALTSYFDTAESYATLLVGVVLVGVALVLLVRTRLR